MIEPNSPTPTAPLTPAPTGPLETSLKTSLTVREAATMAEWTKQDLAKGKISAEQAERIFTDLNTPADQRVTPAETRSEEQKLLNAHFPPATPDQFVIRYYTAGQEPPVIPKDVRAFDANVRGWLSGAGFPRDVGNSLVYAIAKTIEHTRSMSPEQLEQYGYREFDKLQKAHGPTLEERLQAAARMVEALERTRLGLKQLLKSRGVGDNALVANMLMQHAAVYHARRGAHGTR